MPSDPETSASPAGLRLIGAGFGRTGTASLKAALEALGFGPCYHMFEVVGRPDRIALWDDIARGKPVDWRQVFAGYQATVDWPGCAFYEQLMDVYPDAKVLLTVRDPDQWYDSVRATIYRTRDLARQGADSGVPLPRVLQAQMVTELIWKQTFADRFEDRAYALDVFRRHIEQVKQRVPPEKLLVYDVSEGWEPLCAFLGVAAPKDQPFPSLNDRATFLARTQQGPQLSSQPGPGASDKPS
jgi:hypothetical protein